MTERVDLNSKPTNPKDAIGTTKVPLGLLPDTVRIAGAMAFLEGALKYGRYNWRVAGVRASIYYDALMRHMVAWWGGEDIDPDSGLPHLWKAVSCLAVLLDAEAVGKLTDDRPPRVNLSEMMERLRGNVRDLMERYQDVKPYQYTIADTPPVNVAQADEPERAKQIPRPEGYGPPSGGESCPDCLYDDEYGSRVVKRCERHRSPRRKPARAARLVAARLVTDDALNDAA